MWTLMGKLVGIRELRRLTVVFGLSSAVQGVALALMIPFLRSFLGDRRDLALWLTAVVVLGVASLVLGSYATMASYRISVYDVCDALIRRIGDHVLALPLGWFDARSEAAVASGVSREVNTISHVASIVMPTLCDAFIIPGVMAAAVVFVDWRLALIMLLAVGPMAWAWALMRRRTRAADAVETQAAARTAGRLIEYARLQSVLRSTGAASTGWPPLEEALDDESRATLQTLRVKGRPAGYFTLSIQIAFALVMAAGLSAVMNASLDEAAYLAIMAVTARMVPPLSQSVLFVAGIDLKAEEGAVTALVGPSGAGKSTLLRLAARFWDVDRGGVTIGGADVRRIPTRTLMGMTSMVFQDVFLFDTTIRENVRMARPEATDAELEEAARNARLDTVVASLPGGWDTVVGQGGLKLSGGERQRVSIARAFLKDAPILLLDEITSALDGESEAAITEVMGELARGRTVVVVAHRLSTVRDADRVIFLQPGPDGGPARIAQCGDPRDLAVTDGPFKDFVDASSSLWRLTGRPR